jgi:hypothetical protein
LNPQVGRWLIAVAALRHGGESRFQMAAETLGLK